MDMTAAVPKARRVLLSRTGLTKVRARNKIAHARTNAYFFCVKFPVTGGLRGPMKVFMGYWELI